mgnify:CR=1 FL=1
MNIAYPFLVGDLLLEHAKGNLDQAVEFLTKYGVYRLPEVEIKTQGFGVKGSGFYGRSKGEIKSPYGTKTVESDPEREIQLYPLKRLFNQTQKEISSIDLKSCNKFRLSDNQLGELNNIKMASTSIVANQKINKNEMFNEANLTTKRPGTGISPKKWDKLIGKKSKKNYQEGAIINAEI